MPGVSFIRGSLGNFESISPLNPFCSNMAMARAEAAWSLVVCTLSCLLRAMFYGPFSSDKPEFHAAVRSAYEI
jgi:hypothetical protein